MVVAVDDPAFDVTSALGSLQRVSPPEPCGAVLCSIQKAMELGASDDILRRWRDILLTTSFPLEVILPGDARFWRAQNLREQSKLAWWFKCQLPNDFTTRLDSNLTKKLG